MNDIDFLNTILPSTGLRCIALVTPSGAWHHLWGTTNAWLANVSKQIDTAKNVDVYYGCSSFTDTARDVVPKLGGGRKQVNVAWVRSFWVDLDVGESEPGKPPKYATQKLAAKAILKFALDHGLPQPWLVSSGWGVHAYWPMDADMLVSDWKPVAEALKRALRAGGILFDPSRTADEASVLRPLGTRNHKRQPKRVRLVATGTVWKLDLMRATLTAWVQAPAAPIGTTKLSGINAALGGGMQPDPSSALLMADNCAVMAMMRDTKGNLDQSTWYYSLGVLLHTDEAPGICHTWSEGHADYKREDTDAALARLSSHGATTCAKLDEYQHAACAACPHWGKITSPIQLGRPRATVETVERVVDKKGFVKETATKVNLPWGYGSETKGGRRVLTFTKPPSKDAPAEKIVVSETFLIGVTRLDIDDIAHTEWEADDRDGPRRFVTENSAISKGGIHVAGAMGAKEIYAKTGMERHLESYLKNWMQQLKDTSDRTTAHKSFGWAGDEFVLGDGIIKADGTASRGAVFRGAATKYKDAVGCKGDLATWVSLVDRAYNAPGQEAFQFQLGCAFAAPLLSLMQQVRGITVYAHTPGSGKGKTTVTQVGLSVWGDWNTMMMTYPQVTINSLWGIMGAFNSLPAVFDELTNCPNDYISELVFSMSAGRAKERMDASGGLRANNSNWSTILLASGNSLLSEKLAQHRYNTEAEVSRLFEFTSEPHLNLSPAEANDVFPQFLNHYGHAGRKFATFVTKHRARVIGWLRVQQDRLTKEFNLTQVERHWSALFATVIVALHICRKLDLLAFEVEPIKVWIADRLEENRGQRNEAVTDYGDLLGQMLDELYVDVLVTTGLGHNHSAHGVLINKPPRGNLVGRRVYPTTTDPRNDLLISRTAIQQWCSKKMISPKGLFAKGVEMGWLDPEQPRRCLGRGTKEYQTSDNIYCWRFIGPALQSEQVPQLAVVQGGKP